ncbi:DUF4031 domain-containing protein [Nesterenkonia lutea]|uniref:Metal-dependent HD superfamily phosphohydrolase n=1 Tax=Nesterenkonia lutea TaxID=272919 RepID=A0ABR9JHM4_9MICC|nr:DUF4031 domain-containing protein [Nesterenkonia lutea]MBE1525441.1 putative metal-dependent HD superfamily phosphohydrolase [Nesterenkonia lutea]
MTVFIDPPNWPAHGTVFSHLISDTSLQELHAIADSAGISIRAFDQDHYDVPAHRYADLLALGAAPVSGRELTRILLGCGLRIPAAQRPEKLRGTLARAWTRLGLQWLDPADDGAGASRSASASGQAWAQLGEELLDRWSEPHRHYHSLTHLAAVLRHVAFLDRAGELAPDQRRVVALAAWFHDAVYSGAAGEDEEASARLAEVRLEPVLAVSSIQETARLVRLTTGHDPVPEDGNGAVLVDSDLAVLGQTPTDYARYADAVRRDFAQVTDADFHRGRSQVLLRLLDQPTLFRTVTGRQRWEQQARLNLREELERLRLR